MELRELMAAGSAGAHYGSLRSRNAPRGDGFEPAARFNPSSRPQDDEDQDEGSGHTRTLRELPLPMALKKAMRQVQQMQVPVVSRWSSRRFCCSRLFHSFGAKAVEVLSKLELWRKTMQKIGGHFGGGIQSYFVFLRFLVVLNFLSFLLMVGFVVVPSAIFQSHNSSRDALDPSLNLSGVEVCLHYQPGPEPLTPYYIYILDLLSGTGFMEYSYMFYGFYNNTQIVSDDFSYNVPLAYLLATAFYFLFCLTCIVIRMGGLTRVVVAMDGGRTSGYSALIFTGWDHGLEGERATKMKQNNLRYRLQVDLEEEKIKRKADSLTLCQTLLLVSLRMFLSLVVLGMIVGVLVGIAYATQFSQATQREGIMGFLLQYLPSSVIIAGNFVVPMLCDQIAQLETYSPSTTVIISLLRAVFLRFVSLAVLLYTLWKQITCNGNINTHDCVTCSYNYTQYQCWETRVGQEMYKLMLFDFLITVIVMILVEFPRRVVVDRYSCKLAQWVGRQEFVVAPNILALVYGQTVVWCGALFCPLLPLINTAKFLIIFYCKKVTLFHNCRPARRTFSSTTSNFFFLLVLLFGWSLSSVVLIYSVASVRPSYGCGPFRLSWSMWTVVPDAIRPLTNSTRQFLFSIGSQAFSIPLFICSCVLLCYVGSLAMVRGKTVTLLKKQHKLEARDKHFLLRQIKGSECRERERECERRPGLDCSPTRVRQGPDRGPTEDRQGPDRGGHFNAAFQLHDPSLEQNFWFRRN